MNDNLRKDFIKLLGDEKVPEQVRMSNQGEDWLEIQIIDSAWGRVQGTYIFSGSDPSEKGFLVSLKWECMNKWGEDIPITSLEKRLRRENEENVLKIDDLRHFLHNEGEEKNALEKAFDKLEEKIGELKDALHKAEKKIISLKKGR